MGTITPLRISVFLSSVVAMYPFESIFVRIKRMYRDNRLFHSKHRFSIL